MAKLAVLFSARMVILVLSSVQSLPFFPTSLTTLLHFSISCSVDLRQAVTGRQLSSQAKAIRQSDTCIHTSSPIRPENPAAIWQHWLQCTYHAFTAVQSNATVSHKCAQTRDFTCGFNKACTIVLLNTQTQTWNLTFKSTGIWFMELIKTQTGSVMGHHKEFC